MKNKPPKEKTYPQKEDKKTREKKKQRKETRGKESIITPVKLLGKWFKK